MSVSSRGELGGIVTVIKKGCGDWTRTSFLSAKKDITRAIMRSGGRDDVVLRLMQNRVVRGSSGDAFFTT